jgi:hypothetical protein
MEYYYQLPILKDHLQDVAYMETIAWLSAVVCGFCWIAPSIAWKQKI